MESPNTLLTGPARCAHGNQARHPQHSVLDGCVASGRHDARRCAESRSVAWERTALGPVLRPRGSVV
eukprot:14208377-Alexandrium_andersonii.AAC.1